MRTTDSEEEVQRVVEGARQWFVRGGEDALHQWIEANKEL